MKIIWNATCNLTDAGKLFRKGIRHLNLDAEFVSDLGFLESRVKREIAGQNHAAVIVGPHPKAGVPVEQRCDAPITNGYDLLSTHLAPMALGLILSLPGPP